MKWELEPGHTAAEFRARHMMVTWVRGAFKDIHGSVEFDPDSPDALGIELTIDANQIWTGEPARDAHLKSADFFDVGNHPTITFTSSKSTRVSGNHYLVLGDLTIRGQTKPVELAVSYQGAWKTPFGPDKQVTRVGFCASATVNRNEFGVSWNDVLDKGGIVVGDQIHINLDLEAFA